MEVEESVMRKALPLWIRRSVKAVSACMVASLFAVGPISAAGENLMQAPGGKGQWVVSVAKGQGGPICQISAEGSGGMSVVTFEGAGKNFRAIIRDERWQLADGSVAELEVIDQWQRGSVIEAVASAGRFVASLDSEMINVLSSSEQAVLIENGGIATFDLSGISEAAARWRVCASEREPAGLLL